MEVVDKFLDRATKLAKGDKKHLVDVELFKKIKAALEEEKFANTVEFTDEELEIMKTVNLLTDKPVIYAANIAEDDMAKTDDEIPLVVKVKEFAKTENAEVIPLCVKIEEELSALDDEERAMFLEDLGVKESGLDKLIKEAYELLGLRTFFTAGEKECRAWTFKNGMKAPQCAGVIHTDFEKGFIKAETYSYDDLMKYGTPLKVKEAGRVRLEGKEYVVQDGDSMLFRINV
jgi:GTP-binding protein YchF